MSEAGAPPTTDPMPAPSPTTRSAARPVSLLLRLRTVPWLIVPLLFVVMIGLQTARPPGTFLSPAMLVILNFTFSTVVSLLIAYLIARSFVARGTPGQLMLGCGVVVWGLTAVVSIAAGKQDPNLNVTIYNVGALIAAICHAWGAALDMHPRPALRAPHAWLAAGYGAAAASMVLVAYGALSDWFPTFFVQGVGGTTVRQLVLGSAVALFAVAAVLLRVGSASLATSFRYWYALALSLLSLGLFAVLLQVSFGEILNWLGRGTQYLGGVCMLVAAAAALHETRGGGLALEAALRRGEERYQALFENMSDGFFLAEVPERPDGQADDFRFIDANPAFEALTGLARRRVVGKRAREILTESVDDWVSGLTRVARTGVPARLGESITVAGRQYAASAYSPRRGVVACLLTDTTDRERAARALRDELAERRRMEEQLRDADRRKNEFLSVLSHELRNPLAPIRNSLHVLAKAQPGTAPFERARAILHRQTDHLTRLVDDLLDVTRITRGKVVLDRKPVDLAAIVRETCDDGRSLFDEGGIALRVDVPHAPLWVDGDATRLSQIVGNLLQNAAKFTPRGGGVDVAAVPNGRRVRVEVRDDGIGIEAGDLERVFEPFTQVAEGLARSNGGLGLGLALTKGLVELHGGTVGARSGGRGRGASFLVDLPLLGDRAPGNAVPGAVAKGAH